MKKILCFVLAALLAAALFSCAKDVEKKSGIVCTAFAAYDLARNIAPQGTAVTLLSDGADPHSYEPDARALASLYSCELAVCVGGESEEWCHDAAQAGNFDMIVLSEKVNGIVEHDEGEEHGEHGEEVDEHFWMSPREMRAAALALADKMCEIIPEKRDEIKEKTKNYAQRLESLDGQYRAELDGKDGKFAVVADRFPFAYLARDYDIEYIAAFDGCSAESEASFETVKALADALRVRGLSYVVITETGDKGLADTVISSAGVQAQVLTLDSMQQVSDPQNADYIKAMEENLTVLKKLFG